MRKGQQLVIQTLCLLTAVNECEEGTAACDPNSHCIDVDNGYMCRCNYGYYGDGKIKCSGSYQLLESEL